MYRVAIVVVLSLMLFASGARAQFPSSYVCTIDDTTEVFDGDRTTGHLATDLDGDTLDHPVEVELTVQGEWLKLQDFSPHKR